MNELNSTQKKVAEWLRADSANRDLEAGATLLLQITRNRILHQNVVRRRNFEKIEYVLKKYMKEFSISLSIVAPSDEDLTNDEDVEQKLQVATEKAASINPSSDKGKRDDHDSLPDNIKALYEKNVGMYHELRSLHERLKLMSEDEKFTSAQRLEYLNTLIKLDDSIRANWDLYDNHDVNNAVNEESTPAIDVKRIQSNRTYLSRAITAVKEPSDKVKAECLVRYNELIAGGHGVDEKTIARLVELGIIEKPVDEK